MSGILRISEDLRLPVEAVTETVSARPWVPAGEALLPTIIGLDLRGCPAAVLRGVGTIVVFAVYRMAFGWPWLHVFEEGFEAISPTITDDNSPSAIIGIVGAFRIQTSRLNSAPRFVFTRVRHAVGSKQVSRALTMQATTRLNLLSEMVLTNLSYGATVTPASPHPVPCSPRQFLNHHKAAKSQSAKVGVSFDCFHARHYSTELVNGGALL